MSNVRSNVFELTCEGQHVSEVVSSLLHSIIFYRCYGKFQYKHEGSYSIGTLGFEELSCDFIDFSYVRCASPQLIDTVNGEVRSFVDKLRHNNSGHTNGAISLEFYSKKRNNWFNDAQLVWEIWTLKVNCEKDVVIHADDSKKSRIEDVLLEKIITITQIINNSKSFLPQMPNQQYADTIFDMSYADAQPYLFKIRHNIGNALTKNHMVTGDGHALAIKKMFKETFAM